eukprot:CAMPEP_0118933196 /NCGR_PEP_ID=MMETSP1169-20130426/11614_1 /TAXON_ID=36882 /ORGANISM="Pyramimonas obovata, Strain CCMP722" /LENGTH=55 /DNA_ID=CAMNT_0006875929 /DNA_START=197 /DNA_END=360 /DNA_ORIENTATION=-
MCKRVQAWMTGAAGRLAFSAAPVARRRPPLTPPRLVSAGGESEWQRAAPAHPVCS